MFIPLRTDRPPKRRPLVTEALIIINLVIYLCGAAGAFLGWFENPAALTDFGHFDPEAFKWWQLFTYQFLHDPHGIWHIAFNMLFLWVFGAAVEDRLGRIGFLGFYLTGGIVAALAHAMTDPSPVIGASGAIAGVTGAFLALFPRSRIQVLFIFFIIGLYSIPSLWFIAFYIVIDVLRQTMDWLGRGGSNVAYMAHLAGYAYGFGTAFVLLAARVLKREEFDIFYLFTQSRRRATFRAAGRHSPGGLWDSASADTPKQLEQQTKRAQPPSEQETRHAEARTEINRLIAAQDVTAAARKYQQLLGEDPKFALSEPRQLDIAAQLYALKEYQDAARAYQVLLERYPTSGKANEVRLLLGLIFARQLNQPQQARELLEHARPKLRDGSQTALADQLLDELGS